MYGLYNKKNERYLVHPRIGIWCSSDLEEAKSMLEACKEYVRSFSISDDGFVIINITTKEEYDITNGRWVENNN